MTQLGLGLAALGRPEYLTVGHSDAVDGRFDPAALEQLCHAVLDAAWDREFDTSTSRAPTVLPSASSAAGCPDTPIGEKSW